MKQWLQKNRVGPYVKVSLNESKQLQEGFSSGDQVVYGGPDTGYGKGLLKKGTIGTVLGVNGAEVTVDFEELGYNVNVSDVHLKILSEDASSLGAPQAAADAEMQQQDDQDASPIAEARNNVHTGYVRMEDQDILILGKEYLLDADVEFKFTIEEDDYEDHNLISAGGVELVDFKARVTRLSVESEEGYRGISDPSTIKQIEDIINNDPKVSRNFGESIAATREFEDAGYYEDLDDTDDLDETIEGGLTFDQLPECVKDNFKRNITISVAFVKKDGTVRHMAFRRNLAAYVASDKPKTDAQLNMLSSNNLMNVYDTNSYIKTLKASGDAAFAAKGSFRNFKLDNVLAFMCGGKVYDMREQNQIKDRFGEGVYNELTKNMVSALASDEAAGQDLPEIPSETGNM